MTSTQGYRVRFVGADEEKLYDAAVADHPWGHVQQSFGWGEFRRALGGWEPIRLVLEPIGTDAAGAQPQPVGAATLLYRRLPIPRLGFLYAPRGPAIDLSDP